MSVPSYVQRSRISCIYQTMSEGLLRKMYCRMYNWLIKLISVENDAPTINVSCLPSLGCYSRLEVMVMLILNSKLIYIKAIHSLSSDIISAVFGIEKSFSIFSVHIELVGFAFDIEKWYWEYWIPNTALDIIYVTRLTTITENYCYCCMYRAHGRLRRESKTLTKPRKRRED